MTDEKENMDRERDLKRQAWLRLRGALKDVYAELGGGVEYLRKERQEFNEAMERGKPCLMPLYERNEVAIAFLVRLLVTGS
jgi:hypothetical protein